MGLPETLLSNAVVARATLRGGEYAWPVTEIPTVIQAARAADLVNIGGQLQFQIPEGGTCECYWVAVDAYKEVPDDLPWAEQVSATAAVALSQFSKLCKEYDFAAEMRSAFATHVSDFEALGGDINDALCFVWYVESQKEAAGRRELWGLQPYRL